MQMDTGNDCWAHGLDSGGDGEDSDICTTNTSLRGQPLFRSGHLFSCRGCSSVSRPSLFSREVKSMHFLEICNLKVLALIQMSDITQVDKLWAKGNIP